MDQYIVIWESAISTTIVDEAKQTLILLPQLIENQLACQLIHWSDTKANLFKNIIEIICLVYIWFEKLASQKAKKR